MFRSSVYLNSERSSNLWEPDASREETPSSWRKDAGQVEISEQKKREKNSDLCVLLIADICIFSKKRRDAAFEA